MLKEVFSIRKHHIFKMKFVAFGDSNTRGEVLAKDNWVNLLYRNAGIKIVNKGVNGNTTKDGYVRFYKDVVKEHPDAVYIMFGTNDGIMKSKSTPKVTLNEYRQNLQYFINELFSINAIPILMTCIPLIEGTGSDGYYYSRHKFGNLPDGAFGREWHNRYNTIVRELSDSNNISCIDLWESFVLAAQGNDDKSLEASGLFDTSGTHLTVKGAEHIYNIVYKETIQIIERNM